MPRFATCRHRRCASPVMTLSADRLPTAHRGSSAETSQGFRLRRQPRVGRFTADAAAIASDLPTRTFNDGPLRDSFRQPYHA